MKDDSFEKLLDFLRGNEENANIVCSFIDDLTPEGFEHYISEYFQKIRKFNTEVTWGFNDKGMDVKGWRIKENGEIEYLIIQCKKWWWWAKGLKDKYYIGENKISEWYGKVWDHRNSWNVHLVYATTKDVTQGGKTFCKEKNIELITYKELVEINREMNLNEWIENILNSDISDIEKEELISEEYRERRWVLLQKKQEVIEKAKREISIEKDKNIQPEPSTPFAQKEDRITRIVTAVLIISIVLYIVISALSFIVHGIARVFESPVQKIEVSTMENGNINTTPNRKKNIQKTIHTLPPP